MASSFLCVGGHLQTVDPDQMLQNAKFDQGHHSLLNIQQLLSMYKTKVPILKFKMDLSKFKAFV